MSYDVSLVDPVTEEVLYLQSKHDLTGGTVEVDPNDGSIGTSRAWLNVTYNYASYYRNIWGFSLHQFHDMLVKDAKPYVEQGIRELGVKRDSHYWKATPGNAGAALSDLLTLMVMCPRRQDQSALKFTRLELRSSRPDSSITITRDRRLSGLLPPPRE